MNSSHDKWIVEARNADGSLNFKTEDPSAVFGNAAITGLTSDQMAKTIFARVPDAVLTGDTLPKWPALINPLWVARRKTW